MDIQAAKSTRIATATKMVIPFDLQCDACGRPTNKGDKLWATKEEIGKDDAFDIEIYRYQFKCLCCRSPFSIKSDPGRYDYVLEDGATLIPKKL
ncbi:hypothetical protein CDL12_28874 [Handroanthus impetiginosus]|uniref:Uncharacterized protein n=1 Tax=Handroanthus impetiginosus TaxID=429701 RepID=A0A2G9G0H7_9LAMI|nr:hypothetical protein CDL12_28874 [Handroanthus impetiginosus]